MNRRKIILNVAVTLDGFIEDEFGNFDWCFTDQDYGMTEFLNSIDTIIMGRKSYDVLKKMEEIPYPDKSILVFTRRNLTFPENVSKIGEDFLQGINNRLDEIGKDIWLFGGAEVINLFFETDLIDKIQLSVHPVILGNGKRLFENNDKKRSLKFIRSENYSSGLVQLFYEVIKK